MNFTTWMLRRKFPSVQQMDTEELARKKDSALVFDVRPEEEYRVSRLPGAVRVNPYDVEKVKSALEEKDYKPGTPVVFYCSVGYRSSKMAQLVADASTAQGEAQPKDASTRSPSSTSGISGSSGPSVDSKDCYNLEGSIFKWANENRPIENDKGPAEKVHPYNSVFGYLLDAHRRSEMH